MGEPIYGSSPVLTSLPFIVRFRI